jgi:hypothetical protein
MFRINPNPTFTRTVKINVPTDINAPTDTGSFEETMRARFRVLGIKEFEGFDLGTEPGMRSFLDRAVVKCDELLDLDGNPVEWSDEVRDRLFDLPHVRVALIRTYTESLAEARKGN